MKNRINSIHKKATQKRKSYVRGHKRFYKIQSTKEFSLLIGFALMFFVIIVKLFSIQVINASKYENLMNQLHYKESTLKAQRGQIYVMDKNEKPLQLTENITVYDIYVEPQHLKNEENKTTFINLITPFIYQHLCIQNGIQLVTPEQCVQNLETFTEKNLLPQHPEFFYMGSGTMTEGYYSFDRTGFNDQYSGVINNMTEPVASKLIKEKLQQKIYIGIRDSNYLGYIENQTLLDELGKLPYIKVYDNYVYIIPGEIKKSSLAIKVLEQILAQYHYEALVPSIKEQVKPKENTYVKIVKQVHPKITHDLINLKQEYKKSYYDCRYLVQKENCEKYQGVDIDTPLLHGLGLEEYTIRHYPYKNFLSHVLGYVNREGIPTYGIEEYMNNELNGKDGKLIGRSSSFIGDLGANEFEIEQVIDGNDIYLTINPTIQKEIETIANNYKEKFKADSISVIIINPFTAQIKALVNAPSFNPNHFNDAFTYIPLPPEYGIFIDDLSYHDIHLYVKTELGNMRKATSDEKQNLSIPKYITKNIYSSEIFVDKNIKYAYEPGSILKAITVAIGIDSDEIQLYDFYEDKGSVKVGPYTIRNVVAACLGENTFLNALVNSCNVGMVRIVQAVGKEFYYNYIKKLGFGSKTHIELAGEEEGFVEPVTTVSLARFLNNSFGLGLKATPLQIAISYSAIINGGYLLKPTIIAKIYDKKSQERKDNDLKIIKKIFKDETSEKMKQALFDVIHFNKDYIKQVALEGFSLAGKSGTSEITYQGKYQSSGRGRTNASFVGLITKDNPNYIVVIQVRRPRTSQWGGNTAGVMFKEIASFIINYDLIPK